LDSAPHILLADTDPVLCQVLADYLRSQGLLVTVAGDADAVLQQVEHGACDLVLLDDMLRGLPGTEVLRRIRRHSELPVVMLSARNEDVDRIVGLELGADDCLPKSCNLRELTARVNAILRRTRHAVAAERLRKSGLDRLELSPKERKATWQGRHIRLTGTEYGLLEHLFNHAGRAVAKDALALRVLGRELQPHERSLDVHVSNLRKKLGRLADGRSPIQTVRGGRYQLLEK
jgi:DNA-binding response OmpR family regulator